jgi:hypothetical protein
MSTKQHSSISCRKLIMTKLNREQQKALRIKLTQKLESFGIKSKVIVNPEFMHDLGLNNARTCFQLTVDASDSEALKFVAGSKKHRQVVLSLQEDQREGSIILERGDSRAERSKLLRSLDQDKLRIFWAQCGGANLPEGTVWQFTALSSSTSKLTVLETIGDLERELSAFDSIVELRYVAPRSLQYFLVGYDEDHLFISNLPGPVKSVAEAHLILMPTEILPGQTYFRQGEFFFVPLTDKQLKEFWKNIEQSYTQTYLQKKNGDDSDHEADALFFTYLSFGRKHKANYNQVAAGEVKNPRHQTVVLDKPHWVFISRELEGNGTNWD